MTSVGTGTKKLSWKDDEENSRKTIRAHAYASARTGTKKLSWKDDDKNRGTQFAHMLMRAI